MAKSNLSQKQCLNMCKRMGASPSHCKQMCKGMGNGNGVKIMMNSKKSRRRK